MINLKMLNIWPRKDLELSLIWKDGYYIYRDGIMEIVNGKRNGETKVVLKSLVAYHQFRNESY